jgi:hypothetical protein
MLQQRTNGVRDRRKLTEMIAASTPEPMMSGSGVDRKGRYVSLLLSARFRCSCPFAKLHRHTVCTTHTRTP